jgi:hypothetical protein
MLYIVGPLFCDVKHPLHDFLGHETDYNAGPAFSRLSP